MVAPPQPAARMVRETINNWFFCSMVNSSVISTSIVYREMALDLHSIRVWRRKNTFRLLEIYKVVVVLTS